MADKNIGLLPSAPQVDDDSLIPIEQQGVAMKMTGRQFREFGEASAAQYVGQAVQSAQAAEASAQAAANSVSQIGDSVERAQAAQEAAETAQGAAESAQSAAELAQSGAEAAETNAAASQAAAATSETNAAASESNASASATEAAGSAAAADASETAAKSAQTSAEAAQSAAEAAQGEAESSATAAQESASDAAQSASTAQQYSGNPAIVKEGHWWIWNAGTGEYEDSGKQATLTIKHSYETVEEMEADFSNTEKNDLAIISADIDVEDNAKLYINNSIRWQYLTDLSGIQGTSIVSITMTSGDHSPGSTDVYTITLSNGTTTTFSVYNGLNGEGSGDVLGLVFTVTLPASGWTDGVQTLENSFFIAAKRYSYDSGPITTSRDEYNDCGVYAEDVTTDGEIVFHNTSDPLEDIVLRIRRLESPIAGGEPEENRGKVYNEGGAGGGGNAYNVVLADQITSLRYALIVENGVLKLLEVTSSGDADTLTLIDPATGAVYGVIVENGTLKLEEV